MVLKIFSILSLIFIDQLSKQIAVMNLVETSATAPFLPGLLQFKYIQNSGASFGILQGKQFFLVTLTAIALLVLLYLIFANKFKSNCENICFILIASGGIGNLIDRVLYGYVIDFLDFQFIDFPVFNIADSFVCVGVTIFFIYIVISEYTLHKNNKNNKNNKKENNE